MTARAAVSERPPFACAGGEADPSWPASSPWVTAVGATRFVNQSAGMPERASDQFKENS